jgi:hypothetical protein
MEEHREALAGHSQIEALMLFDGQRMIGCTVGVIPTRADLPVAPLAE